MHTLAGMKTLFGFVVLFAASLCLQAQEIDKVDATDLDALRGRAGLDTAVVGEVLVIGTTKDGGMTFLNVGAGKKQGFVAVVFRSAYAEFPDGFEKYKNQKVMVTGPIELYRGDQPQIIIKAPEQLTIVED